MPTPTPPATVPDSPSVPDPSVPDPDPAAPDLVAERGHLAASRSALSRMRDRTSALDSSAAGDWVSRMYLESAIFARMKALADDPSVPLFFGRLDYDESHADAQGERFYIGRRHVSDEAGEPMVVDWRARISLAFYRASRTEPMGVELRRRFGFQHGEMTAYEDEALLATRRAGRRALRDPRVRDRAAPRRPDARHRGHHPARAGRDRPLRPRRSPSACRAPPAPARPRSACTARRSCSTPTATSSSRQGVLVVGPNASFLRYIGDVLPALGEIDAQQTTIEELVGKTLTRLNAKYAVRGADDAAGRDPQGRRPARRGAAPGAVVPGAAPDRGPAGAARRRGAGASRRTRWRRSSPSCAAAGSGTAPPAGCSRSGWRTRILVKMEDAGDSPDDRVQDAVARSREVKRYVDQLWPAVDPARLVLRLLGDPAFLAAAADGLLTAEEQATAAVGQAVQGARRRRSGRWPTRCSSTRPPTWSSAPPSLGHVVADEAQDLSPMMLRAVGRRCSTGSTTVLGDLAQATTPWATRSWEEALRHLGKPDAHVEQLTKGFRVPGEVIEYAARLLPTIAPGLEPPTSVRRTRGELDVAAGRRRRSSPADRRWSRATRRPRRLGRADHPRRAARPPSSTRSAAAGIGHAVLGDEPADEAPASSRSSSTSYRPRWPRAWSSTTWCSLEPAGRSSPASPTSVTGLRRLYVCLTRAVTSLAVLHAERRCPRSWARPDRRARIGRCPTSPASGPRGCR